MYSQIVCFVLAFFLTPTEGSILSKREDILSKETTILPTIADANGDHEDVIKQMVAASNSQLVDLINMINEFDASTDGSSLAAEPNIASNLASIDEFIATLKDMVQTFNVGPEIESGPEKETHLAMYGSTLYTCIPSNMEPLNETTGDKVTTLPLETIVIKDAKTGNELLQSTYGYLKGDNAVVHSIMSGNVSSLEQLLGPLFTNPLRNGQRKGRQYKPYLSVADFLADFGLRSLNSLMSRFIYNISDGLPVSAVLQCEMDSIGCIIDKRFDASGLKNCSETLCKCMEYSLPQALPAPTPAQPSTLLSSA